MKIYDDTKIYVCAPANDYTGGPLALHQLASALKSLNFDVQMAYYNVKKDISPVHEQFRKFHLPFVSGFGTVEDNPKNIVVLPETRTLNCEIFSKIQVAIYWLSVDFYVRNMRDRLAGILNNSSALSVPTVSVDMQRFHEFENLTQSEYSQQFLLFNKIPQEKISFIGDYISKQFIEKSSSVNLESKENVIAYNPKKGFEFTKKIMESAPDLNFVPIRNMTPDQVQNLLARSKIYIDFGNHPGKDRIPREAALQHCVVITDKKGSAGNSIDVPIDDDFKFEDKPENISGIIEKIRYVFENFQTEHDRQNSYRGVIAHEQDKFFDDLRSAFKVASPPPVYILQSLEICKIWKKYANIYHEKKMSR